jgi:hypothetical protein
MRFVVVVGADEARSTSTRRTVLQQLPVAGIQGSLYRRTIGTSTGCSFLYPVLVHAPQKAKVHVTGKKPMSLTCSRKWIQESRTGVEWVENTEWLLTNPWKYLLLLLPITSSSPFIEYNGDCVLARQPTHIYSILVQATTGSAVINFLRTACTINNNSNDSIKKI